MHERPQCESCPAAFGIVIGVRKGEGFPMRVALERCSLARPRPGLENLPRWKPRGSWIKLWGKCANGRGGGCIRGAANGEAGAGYGLKPG